MNILEKIYTGMEKTCEIVKKTYGPNGKRIVIDNGLYNITSDGYTVINSIVLEDRIENVGVELLKKTSEKTKETIGDGSTSTVILSTELCRKAIKYNMKDVKLNIDKARDYIIANLYNEKIDCKKENYFDICMCASNDIDISECVTNVFDSSENIICKPTFREKIYSEIYKGIVFDRGYVSPYFSKTGKIILNNAYILLVNDDIKTVSDLENLIYDIKKTKDDLLIIANSYEKEVVDYVIYLNNNFNYNICLVISPEYGNNSKEILDDLSIAFSSNIITKKTKYQTINQIGKAKYIEINREMTIIQDEKLSKNEELFKRITYLKSLEQTYNIKKRISILSGSIAIIYVPSLKEFEYNLTLEKLSNTLSTLKNAKENGVIYGSGNTLLNISKKCNESNEIFLDLVTSISIINNIIIGNNQLVSNQNIVLDSLIYWKEIIINSFDLLELFISIGDYVLNNNNLENNLKIEI